MNLLLRSYGKKNQQIIQDLIPQMKKRLNNFFKRNFNLNLHLRTY